MFFLVNVFFNYVSKAVVDFVSGKMEICLNGKRFQKKDFTKYSLLPVFRGISSRITNGTQMLLKPRMKIKLKFEFEKKNKNAGTIQQVGQHL